MAELRARKREQVREAIVRAAYTLIDERGFDHVTVSDIARRAGVGRTTFFRYFGDKQEVIFPADDLPEIDVPPVGPVGADLCAALTLVRALVVGYTELITRHPDLYVRHERLVASHPELVARSLVKQRAYVARATSWLAERGADPGTAVFAAELGIACFYAGRAACGDDPETLAEHVDLAFGRLNPRG